MKNGAYFVKQKTRTQGWAPPGRLSGLCTLALGLALTRILSTPAAGFSVDPDAFDVVTELVSINQAGTDSGNGSAGLAGLSENGRFVGFVSDATDLVATDTNGEFDVFVRDLKTGTTTLVSVNRAGTNSGNVIVVGDPVAQRGWPPRGVRERRERPGGDRHQWGI